ncbi:MAG: VCBS repeat-containing protein [Ardenticatenaceae bacterium]|nr:VCBS repeat-containing protein [Ardenticatenaceae bacterium]
MRVIRRLLPWLFLLVTAVIVLLFVLRRDTQAAYGTAVALCPGPDLYGYTCDGGTAFAYIDATTDTFLYADDGVITLELPFPFTFYGTPYTELKASSNGNVQFGNGNTFYGNDCMNEGPVADMGDMIAPFWDDLDLTSYGYLEYDVVGEAPDRIYVLEWDDVPRFGDSEDRVTFALQLFEDSQDILFLYEDVTMFDGNNGSSATIGIQSEAQGLALQFGCNQPVVANASRIRFTEPAEANGAVDGVETAVIQPTTPLYTKGDVAELLDQMNLQGPAALADMHVRWLNQSPPRTAVWQWLDLTGDGQDEVILLRTGTAQNATLNDLLIFTPDASGTFSLLYNQLLTNREQPGSRPELAATADLTQDGLPDVVVRDTASGQSFVLTVGAESVQQLPLPGSCTGSLGVMDVNGDGLAEVVRDGCEGVNGRTVTQWNGSAFTILP